jgi:hypothetical protein
MGMEPDYSVVPGEDADPEGGNIPSSFYNTKKGRPSPLISTRNFHFRKRVLIAIFVLAATAVAVHLGIRRGHIKVPMGESI